MTPALHVEGLRPIGLDAAVGDILGGLLLGLTDADDLLVAALQRQDVVIFGAREQRVVSVTWRDSGPIPRRRMRRVPEFATVASLGLQRDLRLTRAYLADAWTWGMRGPRVAVAGQQLSPAQVAAMLPPADAARDAALARVADVRAMYGRMLTDVAYQIENAALFDAAVPLTARFEAALAAWAEVTDDTPEAEAVAAASLVRVTFDAARANAETLGLAHLPATARDAARRAAGAARLASDGATEAERAAAQDQVVRILGSLSLYYLPDLGRPGLGRD